MAKWGCDNGGGDRVRAHIARTGQTFSGVPVWTPVEDNLIRLHYPDYRRLRAAFPHRTVSGIKHRVRRLNVQKKRHVWTNLEILRLRGLYSRRATNTDLLAAFPGLRLDQITSKAGHIGLKRKRKPFKVLGVPILDTIRQKAHACGFTLVDLDEVARTKAYFRHTTRRVMWKYVARAVAALEGSLHVAWDAEAGEEALIAPFRSARH